MKDTKKAPKWLWLMPLLIFVFYGLSSIFRTAKVEIAVSEPISENALVKILDGAIQAHPFANEIEVKYAHLSKTHWVTPGRLLYNRKMNGLSTTNGYFSFITPAEVHQSAVEEDGLFGLVMRGEGMIQ